MQAIKNLYAQYANTYLNAGWHKENKNTLFNKCLEAKSVSQELHNAYISALMYRYWDSIKVYYKKDQKSASMEDVYERLLDVLFYTLDTHVWTNPDNVLYNDPNGPDKAFNIRLRCARLNHYERTNTSRRKAFINALSLDQMAEKVHDCSTPPSLVYDCEQSIDTKNLIQGLFCKHDYFSAFLVHNIMYECPCLSSTKDSLYKNRLAKSMRHLNVDICRVFSSLYNIDLNQVEMAAQGCMSLSRLRMNRAIQNSLVKLRRILVEE